ncbi:uncharacterized protein LOC144103736 [Amblyomma americanum]
MIKIKVENVTKNENLSVIFEGMRNPLDGPKTLEKLEEYGKQRYASNDTVFYLFTAKEILRATERGDKIPLQLSSIQTHGTFCSTNISAAVVTYVPANYAYEFAVQATAEIVLHLELPVSRLVVCRDPLCAHRNVGNLPLESYLASRWPLKVPGLFSLLQIPKPYLMHFRKPQAVTKAVLQ